MASGLCKLTPHPGGHSVSLGRALGLHGLPGRCPSASAPHLHPPSPQCSASCCHFLPQAAHPGGPAWSPGFSWHEPSCPSPQTFLSTCWSLGLRRSMLCPGRQVRTQQKAGVTGPSPTDLAGGSVCTLGSIHADWEERTKCHTDPSQALLLSILTTTSEGRPSPP